MCIEIVEKILQTKCVEHIYIERNNLKITLINTDNIELI